MDNNNYLIPANASRGKLILGFFRGIDLIIFGTGAGTTLLLMLIFQGALTNWGIAIAVMAPALITGFLVIPIPYQHNILVLLTCIYKYFFVNRQRYYWKGWCVKYGEEETSGAK